MAAIDQPDISDRVSAERIPVTENKLIEMLHM